VSGKPAQGGRLGGLRPEGRHRFAGETVRLASFVIDAPVDEVCRDPLAGGGAPS
jgi:hypothetical protein